MACEGQVDNVPRLQAAGNDGEKQLEKYGDAEIASCARSSDNFQWLLQAAETVFPSSSTPPDVLTEEPVGERRPLLLAALTWAIETEKKIFAGRLEEAAENDLSLAALLLEEPSEGQLSHSTRCQHCGNTAVTFSHTLEVPGGPFDSLVVKAELPLCRHCLVNSRDTRGCTPAFYSGSHTMLGLLLDNGASPDAISTNGDTLLHALVYNARRILSRDMVNRRSLLKTSESADDDVCSSCRCNECSDEDQAGVSAICRIILLLKRASRASLPDGKLEDQQATPSHGAHAEAKETTPLVDRRNAAGWTPLHLAASRGYLDVCKVLLDIGADPTLRTKKKNLLAADLALQRNHKSTFKALRRAADDARPLSAVGRLRRLRTRLQRSSRNHPLLFVLFFSVLGLICLDWQGVVAALQIYFPGVFGPLQ
ncbi:hypothetical protein Emed_003884 [Eimeria media]